MSRPREYYVIEHVTDKGLGWETAGRTTLIKREAAIDHREWLLSLPRVSDVKIFKVTEEEIPSP